MGQVIILTENQNSILKTLDICKNPSLECKHLIDKNLTFAC